MKKITIFCCLLFTACFCFGQSTGLSSLSSLPIVYLKKNLTIHFSSALEIKYADVSDKSISMDLPLKNVLKIRLADSLTQQDIGAVLTIITENSISQFRVFSGENFPDSEIKTSIEITPELMHPFDFPDLYLTSAELKSLALGIIKTKHKNSAATVKSFGIEGRINGIFTLEDYIFIDLSFTNLSALKYDIEDLRFSLEDKKVNQASNAQSVGMSPEFALFQLDSFKSHYRNVFVFRKFNYPGNKVFRITLSEKQISGRILSVNLKYAKLLSADTLIAN